MKSLLVILCLMLSFNVSSHCGSCGGGGDESDHAAGEDTEHHEKDAQYNKNAGKRAQMEDEDEDHGHDEDHDNE